MDYKIKIKQFEGPFDLLLFFIERDDLDIHDIPIAQITKDFLEYIRNLEELNIEVASEFIYTAASLMRIKAKMLLPRRSTLEDPESEDPRTELVQRLLAYKRFKEVLPSLRGMELERARQTMRGNLQDEIKGLAENIQDESELESISLYKLMKAFNAVMNKFELEKAAQVHRIIDYGYTVDQQKDLIIDQLSKKKKLSFHEVFNSIENRIHAIVHFLALLELLSGGNIYLLQGEGVNNFWIKMKTIPSHS